MKKLKFIPFFFLFFYCTSVHRVQKNDPAKIDISSEKKEIIALEDRLQTVLSETEKADIYVKLAKLYLIEKNYVKAVELLKAAESARNGRNLPYINYYLGRAYYDSSDFKSAISYFRKSESIDGEYETYQRKKMLIESYFAEKEYGRGLGLLGRLTKDKSFKKDIFYYNFAGTGLLKIKEYNKSRDIVIEGLRNFPESLELHNLLKKIEKIISPKESL